MGKFKARHTTHGKYYTRIYRTWRNMINRCENSRIKGYKKYGAKGTKVCEEWRNDFMAFYNWAMDNGYRDDLTIDRIDFNGNYEPNNCRWATIKEQANNKSSNIIFKLNDEKLTLHQISEKYNINYKVLFARIKYLGWSIEQAINTPIRKLKCNITTKNT